MRTARYFLTYAFPRCAELGPVLGCHFNSLGGHKFTLLVLMDAAAVAEGLKDFTSSAPAAENLAEALALEVFNYKGERIHLSKLACDSKQTSVVVFGRNLL